MKSAAPSSVKDISEVHTPLSRPSEGCLFPVDTKLKSSEAGRDGARRGCLISSCTLNLPRSLSSYCSVTLSEKSHADGNKKTLLA